ncbi:MAG TPA: phosphoribosylformylglycinamidine synthase subunit PurL, partial [Spirochaetota bacterium]|nr:phosphoribosylformylglycinamidine synthase subunit PurL [Spirochaetota bacterium]
DLTIINAYNLFGPFSEKDLLHLKEELFCDNVCQDGFIEFYFAKKLNFDFAIEVSYKNGVTDNVGRTAARGVESILKRKIDDRMVRASTLYLFKGKLKRDEIDLIATKVLCNVLIEDYFILTKEEINNGKQPLYHLPVDKNVGKPYYENVDLEVSDDKLIEISNKGLLSLTLEEMKAVRDYYKRIDISEDRKILGLPQAPTDVELEVFAQTWSEHCKHKIFASTISYNNGKDKKEINSLFKTYIQKSTEIIKSKRDDLLSLFKDNAGVVKLDDKFAYCVKVETHNSPSALDPYGGAMTGIVGVNRDIIGTGIGAYPIFNTDIFCFGAPFTNEQKIPEGLLPPRRIFRGVHRGVKDGGNESGIPTVNGAIVFDDSFLGKPLVFCGTGGLMPLSINGKKSYEKYTKSGDLIVVSGGRTGKDGIHGATFSSAHLTETSPTSAVQIGDPITQKKLLDFIIEARDLGLYSGLTDNGAGGLSSSVGEMAQFTNGATLYLDKCPLKYSGLKPWEILVSEAQERMTLSVPKDKIGQFLALSKKRDVESTVIGEFNESGYFSAYYNDEVVSKIEMNMLHNGCPKLNLVAEWNPPVENKLKYIDNDYKTSVRMLLASPNIASKEHWVRMYDHEVQARTINKPFTGKENDGPSDGGVLRIFKDKNIGLVITNGITPRYSKIDTYHMTANVIDEAYRQAIILGANPDKIVGLDNFCWPDPVYSEHTPDGKYKLAQLVRSCEAVYDTTIAYNCPCISGKDSMKNDYRRKDKKISVLPTLLFTAVGVVDDITKTTSFYFKKAGDLIFLLGETKSELGASEYYNIKNIEGGVVPKVDTNSAKSLYRKIHYCIEKGLLLSAHDLSDGGLAIAISEAAFSGKMGCEIDIDVLGNELTVEEKLFSESASRILVTVDAKNEKEFFEIMKGQKIYHLGKTVDNGQIIIKNDQSVVLNDNLEELKNIWKKSLIF